MEFQYQGTELDVFRLAACWKSYTASQMKPYLQGRILEVGAGIGSMTKVLYPQSSCQWTALDPDPQHVKTLEVEITAGGWKNCEARTGTLENLKTEERFQAILYMDVLEHIEKDREELEKAALHLSSGNYLIVLAPAHNWLYSPFDKQIGHYRRYTRSALKKLTPPGMQIAASHYLDSFGLLASAANRFLLKHSEPTAKQILFWDRVLVRISKVTDFLTGYRLGKSILMVWRKN